MRWANERNMVGWAILLGVVLLTASCEPSGTSAGEWDDDGAVGESSEELFWRPNEPRRLSLWFRDGEGVPLRLVGNERRYVRELDISVTVDTATDQGLDPVTHQGDLAGLDWSGLEMVEEDWRPNEDGTFMRQQFFRNARWMEDRSVFILLPKDSRGRPSGPPMVLNAGTDDEWRASDDYFIRRYNVRTVARSCAAIGDCSTATDWRVEAIAQNRVLLRPNQKARVIPPRTRSLELWWSAEPTRFRSIPVEVVAPSESDYTYGINIDLQPLNTPESGFYLPGDEVEIEFNFYDDAGNLLPLPTYGEYFRGGDENPQGIMHYDLRLNPTLYYSWKHREGLIVSSFSGPTDRLNRVSSQRVPGFDLIFPPTTFATVEDDGYVSQVATTPTFDIIFDPSRWDEPLSNRTTYRIPDDAPPGTYLALIKVRREFGGEAVALGESIELQVGTLDRTEWTPNTGPCTTCHQGESRRELLVHGFEDQATCFSCHASLGFEPDNALDYRIHYIHSRSERYPGDVNDCSTCHLSTPTGPPRGFPGIVIP